MKKSKPKKYWNIKENCAKEALKWNSRSEFQKKSHGAYVSARLNGWLDEICSHMKEIKKPNGYWLNNKKRCHKEALKYKRKVDFMNNSPSAYNAAKKNGWLNEICSHMLEIIKPVGYWSNHKDRCHIEALKYNSKKDFRKYSNGAYSAAVKYGWLNEICSHMIPKGNRYFRLIYVYEFSDNSAYVGLTKDSDERYNQHVKTDKTSGVYKHIQKTRLMPVYKLLTDYIPAIEASIKEGEYKEKYKNEGWNILNIRPTGGLGSGIRKWTEETTLKVARTCETKDEFHKKFPGAYDAAKKYGWFKKCCKHMIKLRRPKGYWTLERCLKYALKCKTRTEFKKKYPHAYCAVFDNNFTKECFQHMVRMCKPNGFWHVKENCLEAAKKCNSKTDFKSKYPQAVRKSRELGWLKEIYAQVGW